MTNEKWEASYLIPLPQDGGVQELPIGNGTNPLNQQQHSSVFKSVSSSLASIEASLFPKLDSADDFIPEVNENGTSVS
jgi:hypothetical protein